MKKVALIVAVAILAGCAGSEKKLTGALETAAEIATGDCGQKVAAAALACAKHIPVK